MLRSACQFVDHAVWVPAFALGHLHISEVSPGDEALELSHSHVEGDWPRRAMRGIAGPSAEFCDDPCRPRKSVGAMVVLLQLGPTFHCFVDRPERLDLFFREDKFSRQFFATIAGLNELNDDTCHSGGDRHQLDQTISALDMTILCLIFTSPSPRDGQLSRK